MLKLKKYSIAVIALIVALCVGILIGGCTKENKVSATKGTAPQAHANAMPDRFKGVHTVQGTGTIDVAFSPNGGITNMIVNEINKAQKNIKVQAYSFTSQEIIKALINANKRGVDVSIIIDKSNVTDGDSAKSQKERELLASIVDSGIAMKVDSDFQIAHSKIMIVDEKDVITGSFNFTYSAENNNAENCLIIHDNKELATHYMNNFGWRWNATPIYKK